MISVDRLISGAPASTLDKPIEHLKACHRRIEDRLATLGRAGEHFESRRAEALTAIENALAFFRHNGVLHTEDEENSLFPRLRPLLSQADAAFVAELEHQHDEAERLHADLESVVEELRRSEPPAGALERYRSTVAGLSTLYRSHIDAEDNRVFAIAQRLLTSEHLEGIATEMRTRRPTGG